MIKANVNSKYEFSLDSTAENAIDLIEIKNGVFSIIKNNKSYNAEVLIANHAEKSFAIRINGNKYNVLLRDKYDDLLKELGMENAGVVKIKDLKAPMPGLVVDVRVKEGDVVKSGDALVVLQAMKMENVLKASTDVTVKKVHIKTNDTVEKNQMLISFI